MVAPVAVPCSLRLDVKALLPAEQAGPQLRGLHGLPSGNSSEIPETVPTALKASDKQFPLIVTSDGWDVEPACDPAQSAGKQVRDYLAAHKGNDCLVLNHGALLFRGLPLKTADDYNSFIDGLTCPSPTDADVGRWRPTKLAGGGTARTQMAKFVRTASDEPPEQCIEPHCDMAHTPNPPSYIGFFMLHGPPAGAGGETVLVNLRGVTRDVVSAGLHSDFESHGGVRYKKQLWSSDEVKHSFNWQQRFFTDDKADVDKILGQQTGRSWSWSANDKVEWSDVLPAMHPHPATGEPVWFNGIHTNHRDYFELSPFIDTSDGSPFDTCYADGEEIDDKVLASIRGAWWNNAVATTLQSGDFVLVDQYLVGHGRMPWTPGVPRKMLLTHFE